MAARLATSLLIGALIRKAESDGGFAALLEKGDENAGSIILILTERGRDPQLFERILQPGGDYSWRTSGSGNPSDGADVPALVARRKRFDPDLWVLELDVPSRERFAAEMNEAD